MSRHKNSASKINPRAIATRDSLSKVVKMLAFKNVKVTNKGSVAFVKYDEITGEPDTLNVPIIPDNASDNLVDAIAGYVDHECGHILFTDGGVLAKCRDYKGSDINPKTLANIHNILEDTYIERKMRDKFPGTARNLEATYRFLIEGKMKEAYENAPPESKGVTALVAIVRSYANQFAFTDFMSDKWDDVKPVTDLLGPNAKAEVNSISNSEDAFNVALDWCRRMRKELEKEEKRQSEATGEEGAGAAGAGQTAKGESSKGKSAKDEGKIIKGKPKNKALKNNSGEIEGRNSVFTEDGDSIESPVHDFDSMLETVLQKEIVKTANKSGYISYTSVDDKIAYKEEIEHSSISTLLADMEKETDTMIGPMSNSLARVMIAKSQSVYVGGNRRGKLRSSSMHKIFMGEEKVFHRKKEGISKDVAVMNVVDCSGSMHGDRIKIACYSAYAVAAVLDRIGITNEAIGFTTGRLSSEAAREVSSSGKDNGFSFGRADSLVMPLFKGFNEKVNPSSRARFASWANGSGRMGSNADGESVQIAAMRLMRRTEARKIMFVWSDGRPACHSYHDLDQHLREVVQMVEGMGIEVMGVGIESNAVKSYYPRNAVLKSVNELLKLVMTELRSALIKV